MTETSPGGEDEWMSPPSEPVQPPGVSLRRPLDRDSMDRMLAWGMSEVCRLRGEGNRAHANQIMREMYLRGADVCTLLDAYDDQIRQFSQKLKNGDIHLSDADELDAALAQAEQARQQE